MKRFLVAFVIIVLIILGVLYIGGPFVEKYLPFYLITQKIFRKTAEKNLGELRYTGEEVSQAEFFSMLEKPVSLGKLVFQESSWLSMLNLETRKLVRTKPGSEFGTVRAYEISPDKRFLTFVATSLPLGETRYIYDVAHDTTDQINALNLYGKVEGVTYKADEKKTTFQRVALPLVGGIRNQWYGIRSSTGDSARGADEVFHYDGETKKSSIVMRLPEPFNYSQDIYLDSTGENFYILASRKKIVGDRILQIRLSERNLKELDLILSGNTVRIFGLGFITDRPDRLWVYRLRDFGLHEGKEKFTDEFVLINPRTGFVEQTLTLGRKNLDDYFTADIKGNLFVLQIQYDVFGTSSSCTVFQIRSSSTEINEIYKISDCFKKTVRWFP